MSVYALIMAGGGGKRFWPMSSKESPKQFLRLINDKSLIRNTFNRLTGLIDKENIFVVTTKDYKNKTAKHLPEICKKNILAEPEGKNTGPCIYYGSKVIYDTDRDAVIVVLPADHAISNNRKFLSTLKNAIRLSSKEIKKNVYPLVTLGIKPTRPDTGYGYIKKSAQLSGGGAYPAYKVSKFTEKPDATTARRYIKSGSYFWNSGIFIWKASSILAEFSTYYPGWDKYSDYNFSSKRALTRYYNEVDSGPVDKMILEKSKNTVVIPADFPWSDIGTWESLDQYLRENMDENIIRGNVKSLDAKSSLIISRDKPIITIGIKDLVVVDSADGILVINKKDSQKVKQITEKLGD
ncbi:MAG: mannose-1-phosphate guanylyltransferase [Candidatus Dadabacteria bacterium]|nr:mannose-1-phosphate guanylyltransferase [Candidatus Dadabacteria bacterium]NIS07753.1 mannose-1-phosphate guanylyltransferase [Candidatus Dadabacteria bacterium]NIV40992.1 mannose-1-phosphate guanylyltransferase [Candidatus Dadabacteria bacterium]NIX14405.1 mannose-1-phosphate guanylyltransferase [Candidatus Dadabacteria bacterium]NIY20917.1 mannose-1-phosphate guanylyltransferase [Candidatus Dadabacteria bacterium]